MIYFITQYCYNKKIHAWFTLIKAYLSPELSIDVIGRESRDGPQFGHRAEITSRHHQTDHTVPAVDK